MQRWLGALVAFSACSLCLFVLAEEPTGDGTVMPGLWLKPKQKAWECRHGGKEKQREIMHPDRLIQELRKEAGDNWQNFSIDLGAGDGSHDNYLRSIIKDENQTSLLVDGEGKVFERMTNQLKYKGTKKVHKLVTPLNIKKILRKAKAPYEIDALKVDIDSWNCEQLRATLKYVSPKLIFGHINPDIPPGVYFSRMFDPEASCVGKLYYECPGELKGFFGCSLSYLSWSLRSNYTLVQLDYNAAAYLRNDYIHMFPKSHHDDLFWLHYAVRNHKKPWCYFTDMGAKRGEGMKCIEWFNQPPAVAVDNIQKFWGSKTQGKAYVLSATPPPEDA